VQGAHSLNRIVVPDFDAGKEGLGKRRAAAGSSVSSGETRRSPRAISLGRAEPLGLKTHVKEALVLVGDGLVESPREGAEVVCEAGESSKAKGRGGRVGPGAGGSISGGERRVSALSSL
jgi:hypothetical protein